MRKIDIFEYICKTESINKRCYVKLNSLWWEKIRFLIKTKNRDLYKWSRKLKINYYTAKYEISKASYHSLKRLLLIVNLLDVSKKEIIDNIIGFRVMGSTHHGDVILPRCIIIDNQFVEGYALYLAEGDTGANGDTIPRKLRFTNSELSVINLFIRWLKKNFPLIDFYVSVIQPPELTLPVNYPKYLSQKLKINRQKFRVTRDYYNKKVKYRVCCDNALLIDLFLSWNSLIKKACLENKTLAEAYIKGMMAGEGTIYFKRSRYVRIEMRNKTEIYYVHKLLKALGYKNKCTVRSNRPNMWSIFIGAKELKKFAEEIGFGSQEKRNKLLKKAVNKKLKKNQYN